MKYPKLAPTGSNKRVEYTPAWLKNGGKTEIMATMAVEHITTTAKDRVKIFFTPEQSPVYFRVIEMLNERWESMPQGAPYDNPRHSRRCYGRTCRAPWTW